LGRILGAEGKYFNIIEYMNIKVPTLDAACGMDFGIASNRGRPSAKGDRQLHQRLEARLQIAKQAEVT
jgi:hypothetical protein